jgi:hypothetical protein
MRILWNKAVSIVRPDSSIPASAQSHVAGAAGDDLAQGENRSQINQVNPIHGPDQAVRSQRQQHPQSSNDRPNPPLLLPASMSVLGDELYRLAMRWRAHGRWPAHTTAHIARSLGQDVCLQGLERVLWHMGRAAATDALEVPRHSSLRSVFGNCNGNAHDLIRARLHQEHAAQVWLDAFFRTRFADLTGDELRQTRLLDCLDARLIDAGAFASSTYLPGESRQIPADEVMLDGTSVFDQRRGKPELHKVSIDAIRGLARQALARIRRNTERSSHSYGPAANALLRLGPVMRSMDALQVETDAAYRRHANQFLLTEQGERLISVLPMARYLPDVIAARIDDLSHASARVQGLQRAAQSDDPLAMSLSQVGQASALLGVQRSAWDAACRLLLFPESVALCLTEAPSGGLAGSLAGGLAGDPMRDFISASSAEQSAEQSAEHRKRIPHAFNERRLTDTFAHDLLFHDVGDQLHGAIAGYAMSRLWPELPSGRAAGLTQRWCQAWADLMTLCGPG